MKSLLELLTGKKRYDVVAGNHFEWNPDSWTYNLFRAYESFFGRREGIRLEQISDWEGNVYSFTLENYLATVEGAVRAWCSRRLAFKVVLVPQLQLAGFQRQYGISPYMFAVAYDTSQMPTDGTATSPYTYAHTVTGSNAVLFSGNEQIALDTISSVTYNASAMTSVVNATDTSVRNHLFFHGTPATGANNVVVTFTTSISYAGAASYSGCSSTIGNVGSSLGDGTSALALSLTSTADNSWMVVFELSGNRRASAGADTTQRAVFGDTYGEGWYDSGGAITPAGSRTLNISYDGTESNAVMAGAIIAPAVSGPANMKALNTNVKANIKTINTNAIANVKSFNTNA